MANICTYFSTSSSLPCQSLQRFARQPPGDPFVQGCGPEAVVEGYGGRVPVQHRPVHAAEPLLDTAPGEPRQERLARALPPRLRSHIEVFQVDAAAPLEGGEVVEPKGEADRAAVNLGDVAEDARALAEQGRVDVGDCGRRLVEHLFV